MQTARFMSVGQVVETVELEQLLSIFKYSYTLNEHLTYLPTSRPWSNFRTVYHIQGILRVQWTEKLKFSLERFKCTVNTVSSFWCQGCVQTGVVSGNHKTKSAFLFRLCY